MSGRIAKSQIPIMSHAALPPDVRLALIQAKNNLRDRVAFDRFHNNRGRTIFEGPPLPAPTQGCEFYEIDVGQARPGDPQGQRGIKRLVLEVNTSSFQILETYYTPDHYAKFSFFRIV